MLFAKKAKWAAKSNLYRKWLAEKFIHDIPRVAKDKWDDFEADDVLRHIGLTTAKPVKSTFGGLGAFVIGAAVGSIVALMLAPTPGVDLRTQVKDKAMGYLLRDEVTAQVRAATSRWVVRERELIALRSSESGSRTPIPRFRAACPIRLDELGMAGLVRPEGIEPSTAD